MPKDTFFNLNTEKQENILRCAIKDFLDHGFEKANIGTIAKNAGVAKGSMYQYFENKKELFLFSVQWTTSFLMKKYDKYLHVANMNLNFFEYFYTSSKEMWSQLNDERELVIFIQDVFLGKYKNIPDESMEYMLKASDAYMLQLIKHGKNTGQIREDIDDNMLILFMTGVSIKFKEYIMKKARDLGEDVVDSDFAKVDSDIKNMLELMKNGMAPKNK